MSRASIRSLPRAAALRVWRGITSLRGAWSARGSYLPYGQVRTVYAPNAHPRQRVKKSKNVQQPQNRGDHHDGVQNRLDRSSHRNEIVHQPQQNSHHDQNQQYL